MRCFVALDLDEAIRAKLVSAQRLFRDLPGKMAWVKPEQMHLTIKFLGDVPDEKLNPAAKLIEQCTQQVEAFDFSIGKLGAFPPSGRQIRVLWVGVDAPPDLTKLNELCEQAFVALDIPPETRMFSPHLTIARIKYTAQAEAFRRIITQHADFAIGTQLADRVVLYASELRPAGAVHTPLAAFPLRKR
jgi:2'-5' RNA ligase